MALRHGQIVGRELRNGKHGEMDIPGSVAAFREASVLHGWAGWRREGQFLPFGSPFMPHKYNADRRHHIPRPKRRVTNWAIMAHRKA
jgi:hypothetical protein